MRPRTGDVLLIGPKASVQFGTPILFRVIRVHDDRTTYEGWVWLDGYELNHLGDAVERREIFVQYDGLIKMERRPASQPAQQNAPQPPRRPTNARQIGQRTGDVFARRAAPAPRAAQRSG